MGLSLSHLIITLLVILIIFGAGKLPKVMGDLGRGIRHFRDGLKSSDEHKDKKSATKRIKNGKK
ncbi:MAG: twin-arginine translocase TatA/TatE family subunit [Alphaproteobacteria bacterium]